MSISAPKGTKCEMADRDFIELAKKELVHIGIVDMEDIIDSVRVRIKKAYPSYFGTYEQFDKVKDYLNTFENLYCIGRNGQHRYNNMDHSMLTAMLAADALRTGKGKEEIWNVNTEKSYHEKK